MSPVRDLIINSLEEASRPYLLDILEKIPSAHHAAVIENITSYRKLLAEFCLNGYIKNGLLTTDFICGLHKALFPSGFKQKIESSGKEQRWMIPGQYKTSYNGRKSALHPQQLIIFSPPEQVHASMERIVDALNTALAKDSGDEQKINAIFLFLFEFLSIHPFPDANGRVACILADLLAIRAGLPPFYLHRFKGINQTDFYRAIEIAQRDKNIKMAREVFEKYWNQ